jgi:hypothetical protein
MEMFQPVACDDQTGQVLAHLGEPTADRTGAERRVAQFDHDTAFQAGMMGVDPCCRGGVVYGCFMPFRIQFPDGTGEDLSQFRGQTPGANGRRAVEAPEGVMAEPPPMVGRRVPVTTDPQEP